MSFFLTIIAFLVFFFTVEALHRRFGVPIEFSRKLIHVGSAAGTALLPYYLSRFEILIICFLFFFILMASRYLNVFKSIHSVERKTLGEIYFPLGIALSAAVFLPAPTPLEAWGSINVALFQFGVLVMGFADAMAAIIGVHYGKHKFSFVKDKKSVEGSSAFFITTFIILLFFNFFSVKIKLSGLLVLPIVLSFLELILSFGLDNLILPVVASFLLGVFVL